MACMIPPYINEDVKSMAEKKVYHIIADSKDLNEWFCLHSLGISHHRLKVEGEIDFILIGPEGIFCLEVKGGNIKRENGLWYFINRYGVENSKKESPFKQVADSTYSLVSTIRQKYPVIMDNTLWGYGVLFPDIIFNVSSPEWEQNTIYDLCDRTKPFIKYINRLINYWKSKLSLKGILNPSELRQIVIYLRGNFELIAPLTSKIEDSENKIIKLTDEQYKALDRMESNKRILFKGTAGTGKTLLAVEKAKRLSYQGKSVLFLCFNKILGGKLHRIFYNNYSNLVTADSIHKYFINMINLSSLKNDFINDDYQPQNDIYKKKYPKFFIHALNELNIEYDYIILDEGQDLLCYEYITPLDYVLKGGLEHGEWAIFYDSNKQGKLYNNFDNTLINDLINTGASEYKLDINCRNTRPIATQTSLLTGFKVEDTLIAEGEKVIFKWYADNEMILAELIKSLMFFRNNHINLENITILYPKKDLEFIINNIKNNFNFIKIDYKNIDCLPNNVISYSSVSAFKGLENNIIILLDIESLDGDWVSTVNYVGMTRARDLLIMFLNKNLKKQLSKKIQKYILGGEEIGD